MTVFGTLKLSDMYKHYWFKKQLCHQHRFIETDYIIYVNSSQIYYCLTVEHT